MISLKQHLQVGISAVKKNLNSESIQHIINYIYSKQNIDGGFSGRDDKSDLYYSMFAIDILSGFGETKYLNSLQTYYYTFNIDKMINFIDLCCLARCGEILKIKQTKLKTKILEFQATDGTFASIKDQTNGELYATFMAMLTIPQRKLFTTKAIQKLLKMHFRSNGGFSGFAQCKTANVPAVATAACLCFAIEKMELWTAKDWLLKQFHNQGGFKATPKAPGIDLLSTAVSLQALYLAKISLPPHQKQLCLKFVESLWNDDGGFSGHIVDTISDCEYTYYGLSALGYLLL